MAYSWYMDIHENMPYGYRWATSEETEEFASSDHQWGMMREEYWIQVRVGGTDSEPMTDLAVQWDCMIEFGLDHNHDAEQCERIMAQMSDPFGGFDPFADDIMAYSIEAEEHRLGRPLFPNEY